MRLCDSAPIPRKPFKTNCRALHCDVKGWQYKSSAQFKRSELVILLQVYRLEPSLTFTKHLVTIAANQKKRKRLEEQLRAT